MTRQSLWAKRVLEEERAKRGYYCQNVSCWFTSWEIEFAHVHPTKLKGRSRGMKQRVKDIRQFPMAYILLCKDCHYQFDKQGIEITLTVRGEVT